MHKRLFILGMIIFGCLISLFSFAQGTTENITITTYYPAPFSKYPRFKDAKISSIINVKLFHNHHLYWPESDVNLTTEILDNPEKYPLIYK